MATLSTTAQISADILSRAERADDIEQLKAMMDLPELVYVDISAHVELLQALKRWPLLEHLQARHLPAPPEELQTPLDNTP